MKRLLLLVAVFAVLVTACSPALQDLTTVEDTEGSSSVIAEVLDPDSVTIYRNVDNFPNVGVMCVGGDAFVYRSNNYEDWRLIHLQAGTHSLCGG
jgi:hypothetical protein